MHLTHLTLRNFRNYRALDLELAPGLIVLAGDNAQGKSNLLEAIYLLSLTKSHRAESDRETVRIQSLEDEPYTRVAGTARRREGSDLRVQVDMGLPQPGASPGPAPGGGTLHKRLRVNRAPKPAAEVMGLLSAVLFSAEDIGLVYGSPAGRRRFLDVLLSQMSRDYLRTLQGYQKVLAQRNHLLRRIADGHAHPDELPFWDEELCVRGGRVVQERDWAVKALSPLATDIHAVVASPEPALSVVYGTRVAPGETAEETTQRLRERLEQGRRRELHLKQTLVGPHRDDLRLLLDGREADVYGSRGQSRTIALALRLAEARLLATRRGEEPLLLLDDALAELDAARKERVLEMACASEQALLTTIGGTEHPSLASRARTWLWVREGTVSAEPWDE